MDCYPGMLIDEEVSSCRLFILRKYKNFFLFLCSVTASFRQNRNSYFIAGIG